MGKTSPLHLQGLQLRKGGAAARRGAEGIGEASTWESALLRVQHANHLLRCNIPRTATAPAN